MSTKLVFGETTYEEATKGIDAASQHRGYIYVNGKEYDRRLVNQKPAHNPCLDVFGQGPDGATCKTCQHLEQHNGGSRNYYKCNLRPRSGGPGTDHRLNWPACGKHEELALSTP